MRRISWIVCLVMVSLVAAQAQAQQSDITAIPQAQVAGTARQAVLPVRIATFDELLRVIPAEYESVLAIRGKHPQPPNRDERIQTETLPDGTVVQRFEPWRKAPPFDVVEESRMFPHLIESQLTDGWEFFPAIGERCKNREVLLGATCLKNIKNKWGIPTAPEMDSITIAVFRDDFDADFSAALRRDAAEVRRAGDVEFYKYVKKGNVIPESVDVPQGTNRTPPDEIAYLVAAAANCVVACDDEREAAAYAEAVAAGRTIEKSRPAWLRWPADSTIVGFRVFLQHGKEADGASFAHHDPQARGIVLDWSPRDAKAIHIRYLSDKPEAAAWFGDFTKKLLWGWKIEATPIAGGVAGSLTFGRLDDEGHPFGALEGHLLSLLLLGVFITI